MLAWGYLWAADLISWRLEVWQDLLLVELADVHQIVRVRRSHRRCSATHLRTSHSIDTFRT
jgi:hypothetical protein